eukprot:1178134-Prorocentrum_minimum.AAC.6
MIWRPLLIIRLFPPLSEATLYLRRALFATWQICHLAGGGRGAAWGEGGGAVHVYGGGGRIPGREEATPAGGGGGAGRVPGVRALRSSM